MAIVFCNAFCNADTHSSLSGGSCLDIVCGHLSSSPFLSATDMSLAFVHRIVDDISGDQKLTTPNISALASAFPKFLILTWRVFFPKPHQARCAEIF